MKYSLFICLVCTLFLASCKSTSSEDNTFSIEVTNSLQSNLDIYTRSGTSSEETLQGTLNASSMASFSGFEKGTTYILTATDVGGTPDNWYFQTEFNENSAEITISPQF